MYNQSWGLTLVSILTLVPDEVTSDVGEAYAYLALRLFLKVSGEERTEGTL